MDAKELLSEMLAFYKKKVDDGLCTPEEISEAAKILSENLDVYGTIDDFATFYGKSKDAVNSVIKRRVFEKPRRNVVLYKFRSIQKAIPSSWRLQR